MSIESKAESKFTTRFLREDLAKVVKSSDLGKKNLLNKNFCFLFIKLEKKVYHPTFNGS